jgi:plasmid stability protein
MITITIKGIPKETHRELKKLAAAHRRSLNSEVIWVLESSLCGVPHATRHIRQLEKTSKKLARRR